VAVATSDVRRISFKDRRRGALEGLMVGALIGFPAGVLIMDSPSGSYEAKDRIKSAFSGGVAGVFWGAAIGALAGGRITYVFIPPRAGQSTTDPVVVPSAKRR
jgi:uncharacterized membrane protein